MANALPRAAPAASAPAAPPVIAIALISACALAYEVLLMRLFSIIQWHHFAYMMISVALLGYGAAGALLTVVAHRLQSFAKAFVVSAAGFGVFALLCFVAAQRLEFNPLELLWDPQQPLKLIVIYLLLFVPFGCAGFCICLALYRFPDQIGRIYSFDITGASIGAASIVLALFVMPALAALKLIACLALVAAGVAAFVSGLGARWVVASLALSIVPLLLPDIFTALSPSPYKELSQALRVKDTQVIAERSSPLAQLTVVESRLIPFRYAPGLSLNAPDEPPPQLALFSDGDAPSMITHYDGRSEPLAYLDYLTPAAPDHLIDRPRVLVLGAGAGTDLLAALTHGASAIDAVELNPQTIRLVDETFGSFSGRPYSARGVRVSIAEARGYVAGSDAQYDLIEIALLDAFGTASAGLHALSESYLYTVEGLRSYLGRLRPGGLLAITRWVTLPPRDVLKLFATAVVALEQSDAAEPGKRLALIRGIKTATLIVKNGDFTAQEIGRLREFCRARSFDVAYYPGIDESEVNRYTILDRPHFFEGAKALLSPGREDFIARYKFEIAPATDDKPYFFNFFRWSTLPELLSLKAQGGLALFDWGYPVLVATLVQALLARVVFILVPIAVRAGRRGGPPLSRSRVAAYFLAVGLGFMFIEIAFIQKFTLFLSHPLYAVAVVLAAFLFFAGLGSRYAQRALARKGGYGRIGRAVVAIAVIAASYLVLFPKLFPPLAPATDLVRVAVSILLIAPLAFAMGIPFPTGLARTSRIAADLVPWAWAVNGCASVVGAVAATLLAVEIGFTAVVVIALALYGLAATTAP